MDTKSVQPNKPTVSNEAYTAAGIGAAIGAAGTFAASEIKLSRLAAGTVKAFGSSSADCDSFVKKNGEIISRAIDSRKGFFGKINRAVGRLTEAGTTSITEAVQKGTSEVIDTYGEKAAKKLATKNGPAVAQSKIDEMTDKLLRKDVLKSFKDSTRFERFAKVSGAALLGIVAGCVIKEVAKTLKKQNEENKAKEASKKADVKPEESEAKAENKADKAKEAVKDAVKDAKENVTVEGAMLCEKRAGKKQIAPGRTTAEINEAKRKAKEEKYGPKKK